MKTILAIDFDKHAAATYRENFPGVDVRCAKVEDEIAGMPHADVVIGGPPCQSFSLAGDGLGEADPRNGWPAYVASVAKVRPRMFLAENVAGMLTKRHIKYLAKIYRDLERLGYRVEWRLLDSVNFGVPQFLARIWVWGIRSDLSAVHQWPKPTHAWPAPAAGIFGGELLPAVTTGQALHIWYPGCGWEAEDSRCVIGGERKGGHNHAMPLRKMTDEPSQTVGNGFPVVSYDHGLGYMEGHGHVEDRPFPIGLPMDTLRGGVPGCCDAVVYDHGLATLDAPCTTIKAGGNVDASGKQGGGCPPAIPYRWSDAMLRKHPPASPASPILAKFYKGGAEGLLQVIVDDPKHQPHQPAETLRSGGAGHGMPNLYVEIDTKQLRTSTPVSTLGSDSRHALKKSGILCRRLTPAECARLMSMPDDFRWPDSISKTAKYRIVGNGQCSLMTWHMSQAIRTTDPESATCISLFCGGGVGDVGFHGRFWSHKSGEQSSASPE